MGRDINTDKADHKSLKTRKLEFRRRLLSPPDPNDTCKTVKQILQELEDETGVKPSHVAQYMRRSSGTIANWIENNSYIETVKAVARDIMMQWRFEERPRFGFDDETDNDEF